jgi:glucose-1-phosphate thymidylyltransferase
MCVDEASVQDYGATVFAYRVNKPENYGVVEFDELGNPISLEEKPKNPKSNYAVTGLYFYDNDVVEISKSISPSDRGELEITSVNDIYLQNEELRVAKLSRGCTWFDAGTFDNMLQISNYIETVQIRQGQIVSSPDEIAYRNGWITFEELIDLINSYGKSLYAKQLYESILED